MVAPAFMAARNRKILPHRQGGQQCASSFTLRCGTCRRRLKELPASPRRHLKALARNRVPATVNHTDVPVPPNIPALPNLGRRGESDWLASENGNIRGTGISL